MQSAAVTASLVRCAVGSAITPPESNAHVASGPSAYCLLLSLFTLHLEKDPRLTSWGQEAKSGVNQGPTLLRTRAWRGRRGGGCISRSRGDDRDRLDYRSHGDYRGHQCDVVGVRNVAELGLIPHVPAASGRIPVAIAAIAVAVPSM